MQTICLISCVSSKVKYKTKASELYNSAFFLKAKAYAYANSDKWYILSAKYGLLDPDKIIEPYDLTLNKMGILDRKNWANAVLHKLFKRIDDKCKIIFLAGEKYREFLIPGLEEKGHEIAIPMKGLSIGRQLSWLNSQIINDQIINDLDRFYDLMEYLKDGLGGYRVFKQCNGKMSWPIRGVYFIYENGEIRKANPLTNRVVRVGTHAVSQGAKSTFWGRLISHRGTENGFGNHRGSIFRLHIGNALLKKYPTRYEAIHWGVGQSANRQIRSTEADLEAAVSSIIGEMKMLWIDIGDEPCSTSDRAYIEQNSIGLLTAKDPPIDLYSPNWLGIYSPKKIIKRSGLWNLDYYKYNYDPNFLNILEQYIRASIGEAKPIKNSIAPPKWQQNKMKDPYKQMSLF